MRLERLNYNKIKIFLTSDDLHERGLSKEDIWKDSLKWHQLFHDMLEEANEEFGVDIHGSVAVEIFSMQAQGMIMIVTMEEQDIDEDEDEELLHDGFIEMQVTVDKQTPILFEFNEFEHIIQVAKRLFATNFSDGALYKWNEIYYLNIRNLTRGEESKIIALLTEYGNNSLVSEHQVMEYGIEIIKDMAISTLVKHFR